jgi:hypothetical protein
MSRSHHHDPIYQVLARFGKASSTYFEVDPGVYADITSAAVASQLRALGVVVKNVREPGQPPASGCERTAVEP